jgi:acyl-CoA thioester hydrolase
MERHASGSPTTRQEPSPEPPRLTHTFKFRVRYSETDQMGTIYNSRPLEWFEMGRSELLRHVGMPYTEVESRGVFLPLVEAHVEYDGRARYDDLLEITSIAEMIGRARLRCSAKLVHANSQAGVAHGYTVHAFTDTTGRAVRPPHWFLKLFLPSTASG